MIKNRQQLEDEEKMHLEAYACKSGESLGRKHNETHNDERMCFQRDKDRIVHSRSFRRLDEKTQVFMAGSGDHYRTRLTHTLEVAQISRDIARRLGLNEDLCEAVALAHDLGHPPYGHGGEEALNDIMRDFEMNFEHNEQSRKIVETLEKPYPDFDGLNLSLEVLDGLIKHQTAWDQAGKKFEISAHLEAQAVNIADEIAYTNHDMDDGLRAGIITVDQLRGFKLWQLAEKDVCDKHCSDLSEYVLISRVVSAIISMMIEDFCTTTSENTKKAKIATLDDVKAFDGQLGRFSPEMREMIDELRSFLYEKFYMSGEINQFILKGKMMIKKLFEFYYKNPNKFSKKIEVDVDNKEEFVIAIKDYIAGMTDGYLKKEFESINDI